MTKLGGTIPHSKFWGTCPLAPLPVIYAHVSVYHSPLLFLMHGKVCFQKRQNADRENAKKSSELSGTNEISGTFVCLVTQETAVRL